jgi:hypothetical protein
MSSAVKNSRLISIFCLIFLAQCDVWNKPLIERIIKSSDINSLIVTRYPWPNAFYVDGKKPALWSPDENDIAWKTEGWEAAYGLRISGTLDSGETVLLTPDMYTIKDFENTDASKKYAITVTANGSKNAPITTEFYIVIIPASSAYYQIKLYIDEGGRVLPYPSVGMVDEDLAVQLHVYTESGYILEADGLSYSISPPPPPITKSTHIVTDYHFEIPAGNIYDIELDAKFKDISSAVARISGAYYNTLNEAIAAVNEPDGEVTITLLANIAIDTPINIDANKQIKLVSSNGGQTITRGGWGNIVSSLFTVAPGASLTLEGGEIAPLVIDGGKNNGLMAEAALITTEGLLTMNSGVTLQGNTNTTGNGGGVLVSGSGGNFIMTGGRIQDNTALDGGGVYVSEGAAAMSGAALISGNKASGNGAGVYNNGNFTMTGSAVVAQNNDVYLPKNKIILVADTISPEQNTAADNPVFSAKITPEKQDGGDIVMEGTAAGGLKTAAGKFALNVDDGMVIAINSAGKAEVAPALINVKSSGETTYYVSLKSAIDNNSGSLENPLAISLMQDIDIDTKITIASDKHIKIEPDDEGAVTIRRVSGFMGNLFSVNSSASLTLGGSETATLVIDGGKNSELTALGAIVSVNSGGTLTLSDGAALKNNNNISIIGGGGVYVAINGTFIMNGGEISGNEQNSDGTYYKCGGGVYVDGSTGSSGGVFIMNDGIVTGNKARVGGGVYINNSGNFTMEGGEISGNEAVYGGGVALSRGTQPVNCRFTLKDGKITGNRAIGGNGGGVYVGTDQCTFVMEGGEISDNVSYTSFDGTGSGGAGGGIYVTQGSFNMIRGAITGNKTGGIGGGVCISYGKFTMEDGVIRRNEAGGDGGGVYIGSNAGLVKTGGVIYGADAGAEANKVGADKAGAALYKFSSALDSPDTTEDTF